MVGGAALGLAGVLVATAVVGSALLMPLSTQGPGLAADSPPDTGEPVTAPPITDRPATRAPAVVNPTAPPSPPLAPDARTEKERSDDFWNSITDFANYGFVYDDLEAITGDSDLVVVSRVVGIQPGQIEQFDPDPQGPQGAMAVTFGLVEVEVVLKGEAAMKTPGLIQVARLGRRDMTETDLPEGRVILFLKNYAQMRIDEGAPPSSDEDDQYYYARPNGYQGALREMDGVVDLIVPPGLEDVFEVSFPGQLDGDRFQEVIAQIETLAVEWRRPGPTYPFPEYVADELIVEFYEPRTLTDLEIFEVKYRLALDHKLYGLPTTYLFNILDGLDSKLKRRFVADDPTVCRVNLNWLGIPIGATWPPGLPPPDLSEQRPFGRCEGDQVGLQWTPPPPSQTPGLSQPIASQSPPPSLRPPLTVASPASQPTSIASPVPSPLPQWAGIGSAAALTAGVIAAMFMAIAVGVWVGIRRREPR